MGDALDVRLREARPEDAEGVHRVLIESWHATYDAILGREAATERCDAVFTPEGLRLAFGSGGGFWCGVAEMGGSVVAMTNARLTPFRRLFLYMLYVQPGYQRLGLGREIVNWLPEAFPAARTIRLEVLTPNRKAIRFYRQNGFRPIGHDTNCHDSGLPGMLMEKPIERPGTAGLADALIERLGRTCIFR